MSARPGTFLKDSPLRERVRRGAKYGGTLGAVLLGIGLLRAAAALVVALLRQTPINWPPWHDVMSAIGFALAYFLAFVASGVLVGLLWPVRRIKGGAFVLGYIGAALVVTIIMLLIVQLKATWSPSVLPVSVTVMTLFYGTMAGYYLHRWDHR